MPYVALDLETTGFDAANDQIIEIAAIKFESSPDGEPDKAKILDTFSTLINPGIAIPPMITHITGIKAADLVDSPRFEDVRQKFLAFIGRYPIIGHNIGFDVTFLKQKGLPIDNELYDTLAMAGILLPDLPSYSLDTLSRLLKIEHKNKHRALDDTEACRKLFLILEKKIFDIDPPARAKIINLLEKSRWPLKDLFLERFNLKGRPQRSLFGKKKPTNSDNFDFEAELAAKTDSSAMTGTEHESEVEGPPENQSSSNLIAQVLTPETLADFYDNEGPLSKIMEEYETRPLQKLMSEKILDAFQKSHSALIEAGTGTGKTAAYLLSSAIWNQSTQQKIVISTYTHNLQNQILEKDLPLVEKALQQIDPNLKLKVAILKGRKNYLSLKRLEQFMKKDFLEESEVIFLMKVILWITRADQGANHATQSQNTAQSHETQTTNPARPFTGDLTELTLQGREFMLIDEICCMDHVCPHDDMAYKSGCYLIKARAAAEQADFIIINHAILIQNEISESPLLPEYNYLIVDEAHHLEKITTDALTITLTLNMFLRPFQKIEKILHLINDPKQNGDNLSQLKNEINHLMNRVEIFFGLIGIFLEKEMDMFQFQYELNLTSNRLNSADWLKVMDSAKSVTSLGAEVLTKIKNYLNTLEGQVEIQTELLPETENSSNLRGSKNSFKNMIADFKSGLYESEKRIIDLKKVLLSETKHNDITWIFKSPEESIGLKCAPLSIGENLHTMLFGKKKSIILTSATLRTNGNFNYIRGQLSLNKDFQELTLPSHFSYPDQVKIIIPEDLPEPATEGYFLSCANLIYEIIKKNGGRTLALFTSKKALAATFHQIAPKLKADGFTLLAQNMTGGRGKILEHFKDEPDKCAILGTASFWEGVDIKGSDLTCVIMQKLPFDPPDDPIIAARSRKYVDAFNDYQVPRAILRFKQGFGRLIRSSKDTGSIVILDTRLLQKSYGHKFLESLPEGIKILYGTKNNLADLL
ncbi:MAG: helicase C-terminal domain-containing protein [Candidatus Gracilibacteria bacterium]